MEAASCQHLAVRLEMVAPFLQVYVHGNLSCGHYGFFFADFHLYSLCLGMLGADRLSFFIALVMPGSHCNDVLHGRGELHCDRRHVQRGAPGADIAHRSQHTHAAGDFLNLIGL